MVLPSLEKQKKGNGFYWDEEGILIDLKGTKVYWDEIDGIKLDDGVYKPYKKNQFVFLTKYRGKANPITVEAIERLVRKYTAAYMDGKRWSPHKLRHSLAKGFLDEGRRLPSCFA